MSRDNRSFFGLLREIGATLWAYVRGQSLISLIMAALYAAGFAVVHVPWWPAVALVCGLLNLVPRFGGLIAMALAFLLTLPFRGLWYGLGALGVCVVVQGIEGFVLTPRILGGRLALPALVVFLAVLIGGALFGFLGLLLAVPVLAVAQVIWRFFRDRPPGGHAT